MHAWPEQALHRIRHVGARQVRHAKCGWRSAPSAAQAVHSACPHGRVHEAAAVHGQMPTPHAWQVRRPASSRKDAGRSDMFFCSGQTDKFAAEIVFA
jgi:hypothetical protein